MRCIAPPVNFHFPFVVHICDGVDFTWLAVTSVVAAARPHRTAKYLHIKGLGLVRSTLRDLLSVSLEMTVREYGISSFVDPKP